MNLKIETYLVEDNPDNYVTITRKRQRDGSDKWAVYSGTGCVLSKVEGSFVYEPLPSSRTEEFLMDTRFTTPEEAYEFYTKISGRFSK